jgi:nicotinamide-nucleotide amidase
LLCGVFENHQMLQNIEQTIEQNRGLLADLLLQNHWMLATAESCTGGLIAATCTDVSGSSDWFERGFVTYSNAAKTELLGVEARLIEQYGAVSEHVARAMAFGALRYSKAQASVAVTGIAGPAGGSAEKPVGTVWFGFALQGPMQGQLHSEVQRFDGNRAQVRAQTVAHALARMATLLKNAAPTAIAL